MPYSWNKPPKTMRTQTIRNAQQAAKTKPATSSSELGPQRAGLSPEDIQKIATQVAEAIQGGTVSPEMINNLGRNVRPAVQAELRARSAGTRSPLRAEFDARAQEAQEQEQRSKNQAQTLADALAKRKNKKPR
jgi:hypothetical protein